MFPLNTYKFQFQKGISVDKSSLINHTFKSRECHGQKQKKKKRLFFTNMCFHKHLHSTLAHPPHCSRMSGFSSSHILFKIPLKIESSNSLLCIGAIFGESYKIDSVLKDLENYRKL